MRRDLLEYLALLLVWWFGGICLFALLFPLVFCLMLSALVVILSHAILWLIDPDCLPKELRMGRGSGEPQIWDK
jgi:hypothetical protein